MSEDPHSHGGPPTYTQPGARAPTHAERTRTLVATCDSGTLSTVAVEPAGYPFGSVATYALDEEGTPLVLMSTMAEHARNLAEDRRCSLMVAAPEPSGTSRLAGARATLLGEMVAVGEDNQDAATATYLTAHPGAYWAEFPDFGVHRLEVVAVRYVRGFGEMSWVDAQAYRTAEPDPIAPAEDGIVAHMNDDHRGHMRAMVGHYLDVDGEVTDVTMLSCDRYGFELRLDLAAADDEPAVAFGRIGFGEPLTDGSRAREAMIALVCATQG
ncbi:MAG: DUF2470 domain-containing protein [Actinobacteria bacterium]|nr:DUF2470 domain-containing protein [Actinomycetota bacterium]